MPTESVVSTGRKLSKSQKRYKRVRLAGLCGRCKKRKASKGTTLCVKCRDAQRDKFHLKGYYKTKQRERRTKARQSGLCIECALRPVQTGFSFCAICLKRRRRYRKEERARIIAAEELYITNELERIQNATGKRMLNQGLPKDSKRGVPDNDGGEAVSSVPVQTASGGSGDRRTSPKRVRKSYDERER